METMQNKPGLVRRNGTYYARLRVPKNLREQIGKAEIKLSLKTKDRAEANAKLEARKKKKHTVKAQQDVSVSANGDVDVGGPAQAGNT